MARKLHTQANQPIPRGWPSVASASAEICLSPRSRIGRAKPGIPAVLGLVPPVTSDDTVAEEFTATARLEGRVVVTIVPESPNGEAVTIIIPLTGSSLSAKSSIPAWHLLNRR
jgi:hypothetical protein